MSIAARAELPKPETMLTYASILEKPQYWIDPKTGEKYLLATGEIIEAACAALRYCAGAVSPPSEAGREMVHRTSDAPEQRSGQPSAENDARGECEQIARRLAQATQIIEESNDDLVRLINAEAEIVQLRTALEKIEQISDYCVNAEHYTAERAISDLQEIRRTIKTLPKASEVSDDR